MRRIALCSLLALFVLAAVPSAWAQTGSGSVTYVPTWSEEVAMPDGNTLQRSRLKGVVLATDPSVPFHMSPQDCWGSSILGGDGVPLLAYGYCEGLDADGDVWWIWWKNSTDENTWGFMGGTGKFAGIEGGGTTQQNPPTPDGRIVISWEGSWETK